MMTLAELKKMYNDIEETLLECSNQTGNLKSIEIALMKQFEVKDLNDLPKSVIQAYNDYKNLFLNLQSLNKKIGEFIQKSQSLGEADNDEIKWEYFPDPVDPTNVKMIDAKMAEIIGSSELLTRQYTSLKLSCQQAQKNKNFDKANNQCINILSDDLSDEFLDSIRSRINIVLPVMSGKFNCEKINLQLSKVLGLDTINEEDFLHVSFGIDGSGAYFDNQSVRTVGREIPIPVQNKKINDFIILYLEKSKFPASIQPNLKALLTTLCCQGSLGMISCMLFRKFFSLHGIKILNGGQNYSVHFSFNEDRQLKIQLLADQNSWLSEDGNLNQSGLLKGITSIVKIECTIGVNVIDNVPHFTLENTTAACSFMTPAKCPPITVARNALRNSNSLPTDKLDVLPSCMKYLSNYLGYSSLENFYISKGNALNSSKERDAFDNLDLWMFLDIDQNSNSEGKKLSVKQVEFLRGIENAYKQQKLNGTTASSQICKFVSQQLKNPDLSKSDKLQYVYWLQLARELKGNENFKDEIHKIYISLVEELVDKEPELLCEVAKNDPELYQEIVNPDGFFTTKLKLSDEYHAMMLATYPSILQGSQGANFVKILNKLRPEAKLLFLVEFIKNDGDITCFDNITKDFFDNRFIEYLSISVQKSNPEVMRFLENLVTRAPATTVKYLCEGPLAKVFASYFPAYTKHILTQPNVDLLHFLDNLSDRKFVTRFGLDFLGRFITGVKKLAYSNNPEDFSVVPAIALELAKSLNVEADLLLGEIGEMLFIELNTASEMAKLKLCEMGGGEKPKPEQQVEKTLELSPQQDVSTSDDEALALIAGDEDKKEEKAVEKAETMTKLSIEKLKQVEEKPVTSIEILSGKDSLPEKSSVVPQQGLGKGESVISFTPVDKALKF